MYVYINIKIDGESKFSVGHFLQKDDETIRVKKCLSVCVCVFGNKTLGDIKLTKIGLKFFDAKNGNCVLEN